MSQHVFVCYAREDNDFVLKLGQMLKESGIPVWIDQWDIPPGADWDKTVDDALLECSHFLIVLSPNSLKSSEVLDEFYIARKKGKHIVPVLYRHCEIPPRLEKIQHIDLTSAGPDTELNLERLVQALGGGEPPPIHPRPEPTLTTPKKPDRKLPPKRKPFTEIILSIIIRRTLQMLHRPRIMLGILAIGLLGLILTFYPNIEKLILTLFQNTGKAELTAKPSGGDDLNVLWNDQEIKPDSGKQTYLLPAQLGRLKILFHDTLLLVDTALTLQGGQKLSYDLTAQIDSLRRPAKVITFEKTYGGWSHDEGYDVQPTTDGGYIVVGFTDSYLAGYAADITPARQVYLIKTNSHGDTLWTKAYGGPDGDYGEAVEPTRDGGYIIVGAIYSYGTGDGNVYLIKTDSLGFKQWDRTYGGQSNETGEGVQLTNDGGYIVAGSTYPYGYYQGGKKSDVYLIRIDSLGKKLWEKTYGGSKDEYGHAVQLTSDRGYIVVGSTDTYGAGNSDVYMIKTDSLGKKLWEKTYGSSNNESGFSVQLTSDSGYIVVGVTYSKGAGEADVYLIKTDSLGDSLWTKTYGCPHDDWGNAVRQTSDGGYIVVGRFRAPGSAGPDVYLIKTDSLGYVQR